MPATEGDRKVLVAQPLELPVSRRLHGRQQFFDAQRVVQSSEQRLVTPVRERIEAADVRGKVGRRDAILVVEDSAAQDVEQHVGMVMRRNGLLGRALEPVRGGDDAREVVATRRDGLIHLEGDGARIVQLADEVDDLSLRAFDIGDQSPASRLAARKHETAGQEIGAPDAPLALLCRQWPAEPEVVQLPRREQHRRRIEPEPVHHIGAE